MAEAPPIISELVAKFEQNLSERYSATHIRAEFVNRFWKALGWEAFWQTPPVHAKAGVV